MMKARCENSKKQHVIVKRLKILDNELKFCEKCVEYTKNELLQAKLNHEWEVNRLREIQKKFDDLDRHGRYSSLMETPP